MINIENIQCTRDSTQLLLNTINYDVCGNFVVSEHNPECTNPYKDIKFLTFGNDIQWASILESNTISISEKENGDISIDVSLNDPFEHTNLFFKDNKIGVGRDPLYSYKVDIGLSENKRSTGLHIGTGVFGLSIGNATDDGFLPQIIGMGSDKDDAGLYVLGKVSEDELSEIPAIIFDGRRFDNTPLINRPIFGITSGSYNNFKFIIDQKGNIGIGKIPDIYKLEVEGDIRATNIIIEDSSEILDLKKEIKDLRNRIYLLEKKIILAL